jgi:hypothetical protein
MRPHAAQTRAGHPFHPRSEAETMEEVVSRLMGPSHTVPEVAPRRARDLPRSSAKTEWACVARFALATGAGSLQTEAPFGRI